MTEKAKFRCLNCGHKFEEEVMTEREKEQARRENRPTHPLACPKCRRTSVERGWG
jgi:hypothetical protein